MTTDQATGKPPTPTPRYDRILADSQRLAVADGHDFVGVEHLLLAMLDDGQSVATAAIERLTSLDNVRAELRSILDSDGYRTGAAKRGPA